jgi:ribosomal protein L14E/L6E/L27E
MAIGGIAGPAVLERRRRRPTLRHPAAAPLQHHVLLRGRQAGRVVDEVAEADCVEGPEEKAMEVAEEEEHLEQQPREEQLRVAHREAHGDLGYSRIVS